MKFLMINVFYYYYYYYFFYLLYTFRRSFIKDYETVDSAPVVNSFFVCFVLDEENSLYTISRKWSCGIFTRFARRRVTSSQGDIFFYGTFFFSKSNITRCTQYNIYLRARRLIISS